MADQASFHQSGQSKLKPKSFLQENQTTTENPKVALQQKIKVIHLSTRKNLNNSYPNMASPKPIHSAKNLNRLVPPTRSILM